MSQRRDFPTVYAPIPVAKVKADNKVIAEQVRQALRHGRTPIREQVKLLLDLMDVYGLGVCGSSPSEYRRWSGVAGLDC